MQARICLADPTKGLRMFQEVPSQFDFPKMEKRILSFWAENKIYEKSLQQREGAKPFVFFEGPPTANGMPHPGHCLTRAIKDLFPRYKTMTGHHCLRKGGWDTHGLPVEVEVCKELGIHSKEEIEAYGVEPFNRKCLDSVFRYINEWEELTRRMGFWVNLDEAYVTYHKSYVESVWWSLKQLFDAGLLYQGHKIVWWWAQGGTALSAGEVGQGYREVDDPSVYVRFPVVTDEKARALFKKPPLEETCAEEPRASARAASETGANAKPPISLLVWTTTPWTLPSNMFAAVHPDMDYAVVLDEKDGERLLFAEALVKPIAKKLKATDRWKIERTFKGSELVGLRYTPPFPECYYKADIAEAQLSSLKFQNGALDVSSSVQTPFGNLMGQLAGGSEESIAWRIVAADFVTLDSGTGLVHEAPAFGEVDYDLLQTERTRFESPGSIPLLNAVAPNGTFTDDFAKYKGRWVKDCDKDICRDLKERGLLLHQEQYRHDYPFCWRAEEDPLIQYPRRSWFIRTTQFKEDMLENSGRINWLPEHIKTGRFGKFLESNVDWAISRERYWGTPLPIWVCLNESCRHAEAIDSYENLLSKAGVEGLDVWENAKAKDPKISDHLKVHKPYIDAITFACPKCTDQSRDRKGAVSADKHGPLLDGRGSECRMKRVPEVIDCWYDSGAMPIAQWGFPHTGVNEFATQFPADFISEALDQTRGWFYGLTAISVMLFGPNGVAREKLSQELRADAPHPFANCIVLGLLMGEDGLKMSKSKKNYKEPGYIFEHEGADAMRWLFFSGQPPWTSIRFKESAIAEGQREFLIRLYNCYSFFVIYANIDKWTPATTDAWPEAAQLGDLDRWILSELANCCSMVFKCLEAYDNYNAAKALSDYVDALSNWYVRRSRDRFWRSEMDADKSAAYTTLYHCLLTLSKLIAPFTPFFAESMYRNLVRSHDPGAPESVHLCDYPITETNQAEVDAQIDAALNDEVKLIRQLVSCGRAARAAAKLRVRQPLGAINLHHSRAEVIERYEDIIKDELNVKQIAYVSRADVDQCVQYEIKPDFKKIGPKYGRFAPKIKAFLADNANAPLLLETLERGAAYYTAGGEKQPPLPIALGDRNIELDPDEYRMELHAKQGYAAERIPGHGIIVLDTHLTPDLRDEGCARDLVNQIQQVRKKLDLRYEQRIDLSIAGDEEVRRVVGVWSDYIQKETLAQMLLNQPIPGIEAVSTDIEGHTAQIYVKPS